MRSIPMMCHSALVVRYLLTSPDAPLSSVRPARVTGHIASLKWTRPEYARRLQQMMGKEVDYTRAPAEDFASLTVEFATGDGVPAIGEATTSWSFVGAGLGCLPSFWAPSTPCRGTRSRTG
ncbi:MAG: hypothetical protein HY560_12135 [Gemmatimonadetes bacterium]|nr:hypothetical protein [Gemmatimonadota bacterium]